jgi:hypothetical protein
MKLPKLNKKSLANDIIVKTTPSLATVKEEEAGYEN